MPATQTPLTRIVSEMDPPRYLVGQAADMVGKSKDTLIRWRREGRCIPSDKYQMGRSTIPLYTDEDIAVLRKIAATLTAGPKPKDFDPDTEKDHRHA